MKTAITLLAGSLLVVYACHKDNADNPPVDPYVGKYFCVHTSACYGAAGNCYSQVEETLSVRKGSTDSSYAVFGGDYQVGADGCSSGYHYSFCFVGDSLHAGFMNGGLGGGINETYHGVKISGTP